MEKRKPVLVYVEDDAHLLGKLGDYVNLGFFEVYRLDTYEDAVARIDALDQIDAAIIDMMLPVNAETRTVSDSLILEYGIKLAQRIKRRFRNAYVIGVSKRAELSRSERVVIDNFIIKRDESRYLRSIADKLISHFHLERFVNPKCFIVHGHDHAAVSDLCTWLSLNTIYNEPIVLSREPGGTLTIMEKFETASQDCDTAFVLLTRDDRAISEVELAAVSCDQQGGSSGELMMAMRYRARQNVIFETGFFLGTLGREQGRVLLLYQGDLEMPSDLFGVQHIDISKGITAAHDALRDELRGFLC